MQASKLVADWLMRWSRDTLLKKLRLYSHLSNSQGGRNKCNERGVDDGKNRKNKHGNVYGGGIFFKIDKRDFTFIRKIRVLVFFLLISYSSALLLL